MTEATNATPLSSVTQVNTWRECKRKFAFKYIAHEPDPQSPAAALGDEIDGGQLQPYLKDNRPFDYSKESGYIAAAGLAYLPKPQTYGLEVQKHLMLPSMTSKPGEAAPFAFQGYIDLWMPNGGMPDLPFGNDEVIVCDFKSTKSFDYAKTPEQLLVDPQSSIYSTWAMFETGKRVVDLVWLYFATRGARKVRRVHLRVFPDRAEWLDSQGRKCVEEASLLERFKGIDETAGIAIKAMQSKADPFSFEPNPEACENFGGCPFRHKCNLDPVQVAEAHAAKSAREQAIKAKKRSEQGMATNGTADLFARMKQQQTAAGAGAAPTITTAPGSSLMGCSDKDVPAPSGIPAWALATQAAPINPPESALPPAPPIGQSAPAPAATPPATPAAEEPKKKRGRKSNAEKAAAEAATQASAPPASATPPPPAPPEPTVTSEPIQTAKLQAPASTNDGKRIGTLYIDCFPVGKDTTPAEELFQTTTYRIQAKHNVPDYRFIDFKGAGVFAAELAEVVDGAASWGDIFLDSSTPEGAIAKSVLVFRSARVVKGVR